MKSFRIIFLVALTFVFSKLMAQTADEAAAYFNNSQYEMAFESYANLLKNKPNDHLYNYRYAYSAYMLGENELAAKYFEKAAPKFDMAYYFMGKIYFDNYHFEESADAFTDFLELADLSDSLKMDVEMRLDRALLGERLIKRVEDIKFVDSVIVDKKNFLDYLYFAKELGSLNNLPNQNKALISGTEYITERGDRKYFTKLIDNQFKLFTSQKLLSGWDAEKPVAELNHFDELNFPFLLADGLTFYFGAEGDESLGGYDIFITRLNLNNNQFLVPENIGMPFNSIYNDYLFVLDENNQVGWFVTDRFQPEDKVVIYQFIPNREKIIVQSDKQKDLIHRARLDVVDFEQTHHLGFNKGDVKTHQADVKAKRIFINNRLIYDSEDAFVSETAKNYYYLSEKLSDELKLLEKELKELRLTYRYARDKSTITSTILKVESRKSYLLKEIEQALFQMRQEENKILSY